MIELNAVYCEENLITLGRMPDNFIDLTVTSPPYDDLDENLEPTKKRARDYKGHTWEFKPLVKELFRVTKDGGVVVWVVADRTVKGSETGTSFRQALYFMKCGFGLFDTMIYKRHSPHPPNVRYWDSFEYMFVFSKGKPRVFNPITQEKAKYKNSPSATHRKKRGDVSRLDKEAWKRKKSANKRTTRIADNIWEISAGYMKSTTDLVAYDHPAIFPEKLAEDHILSWSNPGDVVYDSFAGSGTVAKMSALNDRYYIASEPSREYCDIIEQRLASVK